MATNAQDLVDLCEMGNLDSEETGGFPHFIWYGPPDPRHGYRIKVCNQENKLNPRDTVSYSISEDPKVVAGEVGKDLDSKEERWIKAFIRMNIELLIRQSNLEVSDRVFKSELKLPIWKGKKWKRKKGK